MANVVFNFTNTEKSDPAGLRENLKMRNISYEERKEGNTTVISVKASSPKASGELPRGKK